MKSLRNYILPVLILLWVPLAYSQAESPLSTINVTFTTIDVPGAIHTAVYGINTNGEVTGIYANADGSGGGFSIIDGNLSLFQYPGGDDTLPIGINDSRVISGSSFVNNYSEIVSFLYDGTTFTTIQAPGNTVTLANGINNAGEIVGGYGTLDTTKAFIRIGTRFKTIPAPGNYNNAYGNGVNNVRQIVGSTDEAAFLYSHGKFKRIAVPGAIHTSAWGINDKGVIVGSYDACSPGCADHGYVLRNGKYLKLDYPGAVATFAFGINAAGQIVGAYVDQQRYHGFVTSPIGSTESE
jgi:uncharacterized membrane protein